MDEFLPRPAYAGLLPRETNASAGVLVVEESFALATMIARKDSLPALRARVLATHGLDLPDGPRVAGGPELSFLATAPGAWLALSLQAHDIDARLGADVGDLASVADQSDGYAVLRLSGPRVRDTLAKGFSVDLHPTRFGPGSAAVTSVAHMGAILWRMLGADTPAPAFHLAVFRSYAESVWHWLSISAAEYGIAAG